MTRKDALRQYGPWVGLVVVAAAYFPRFAKDPVGMVLYPEAAGCVVQGAALRECSPSFSYQPAFAFLMAPFAPMSMGARIAVWYVISVAATVGCFAISEKLVLRLLRGHWSEKELAWLRVATIILSLKFVLAVFEKQAYDTLACLIVLAGLWTLAVNRTLVAGATLALAAAIKATPLIFLPYLVVKRRFLAAAILVVVFALVSLLPDLYAAYENMRPHYLETWLLQIVSPALADKSNVNAVFWSNWMDANALNHSLRGMVARLVDGTSAIAHRGAIVYSVCALYVAIVSPLMLRSMRRDDFVAIDGSILAISMLLLSPMTSRYHFILLVLPYMTVVGLGIRDGSLRASAIVTLIVSFVLGTATSNDVAGEFLTDWSYEHNFLVYSALVLLVFFAYVILRGDVKQTSAAVA
jgi:alpha-1,2-mannosyltransferase